MGHGQIVFAKCVNTYPLMDLFIILDALLIWNNGILTKHIQYFS